MAGDGDGDDGDDGDGHDDDDDDHDSHDDDEHHDGNCNPHTMAPQHTQDGRQRGGRRTSTEAVASSSTSTDGL